MKPVTPNDKSNSEIHEPGEFTLRKIRCGHQESFLRRGSTGPGVSMIQELLSLWANAHGLQNIPEDEHGIFGTQTETLLKEFQLSIAMDNHYRPVNLRDTQNRPTSILLTTVSDGVLGTETLCLLECTQAGQLSSEAWERLLRATRADRTYQDDRPTRNSEGPEYTACHN